MSKSNHGPLIAATLAVVAAQMLCTAAIVKAINDSGRQPWELRAIETQVTETRKQSEEIAKTVASLEKQVSDELASRHRRQFIEGAQR